MTVQVFTVFNKVDFMEGWGTWQESFWEISGNYAQVRWVKDSVRGERIRMGEIILRKSLAMRDDGRKM